jgi:beta-lactamase regulating signal transducer with metallopeptidase domain
MPIDFLSLLASAAMRALGLGVIAFAGMLLFRVRSSAARHAVWMAVLAGMLLQIPLAMILPAVPLRFLPAPKQTPVMESSSPVSVRVTQSLTPASRIPTQGRTMSPREALTAVYFAISILQLLRMALGYRGLRRILRKAVPIPSLGSGIFESASFVVPGSVGGFRPRILLPRAWRDWDGLKLRAVLAHERAHIRRHDWLTRVASQVNVCVFWFHPLAWWIERELARLAEEACDDVALSEIDDQEEYAAALVDIAREAATGGGVLNLGVIHMAKDPNVASDSNVARRVDRILNGRLPLPKPLGRIAWLTLLVCGLPVIYLSAAVKLSSANRGSAVQERAPAMMPEQKPPMTLQAQAAPNPPGRPAPPLNPSPQEDWPVAMCILIDNSGSMTGMQAEVKAAALAFVQTSKPRDEVCIVDFNDEAFLDLNFTSDIRKMEGAIGNYESRGGKAMRDAIGMSLDHIERKAASERKVLVLVTEGYDTSSSVTQEQLLTSVRSSGVPVYVIGLLSEKYPHRAEAARLALGQLADASHGLVYYPKDVAEVESISAAIARSIRKQ